MARNNIRRRPGTVNEFLSDFETPDVLENVKRLENAVTAIDNEIANLNSNKGQLQSEIAQMKSLQPPNADAVQYAIAEIDSGVDTATIEAALQVEPWNLEPADAADVIVDAQEIIAERGN